MEGTNRKKFEEGFLRADQRAYTDTDDEVSNVVDKVSMQLLAHIDGVTVELKQ